MKNKVRTVMKEFKSGDLKSSSGKKVTNPKQAIAIALSEAGKSKSMKEGGHMKESKEMMKKEVSFMKKKGAPKSMIKHEMKEAGMKPVQMAMGGMAKGMTKGMAARSVAQPQKPSPPAPPGAIFPKQLSPQRSRAAEMARSMKASPAVQATNLVKAYNAQKSGNMSTVSQSAPNQMRGVIGPLAAATARGMMKKGGAVKKMAGGGLSAGHKSADGVAKKGKTDTKQVAMKKGGAVKKMRYGGKC
jgi:hypothetical protein